MASDVIPSNRGMGKWLFKIYNPLEEVGPIEGYLMITKDHHTIFGDAMCKKTLLSIPSQNVAWVKLSDEF